MATCVSALVFEEPKSFRRCCLSRSQSSSVPLTRVSWHMCTPGASFLTRNSHKSPCSELLLSSKILQARNQRVGDERRFPGDGCTEQGRLRSLAQQALLKTPKMFTLLSPGIAIHISRMPPRLQAQASRTGRQTRRKFCNRLPARELKRLRPLPKQSPQAGLADDRECVAMRVGFGRIHIGDLHGW